MHKEEASQLFGTLSDPNRVKITKMLYNKGELSLLELNGIMNIGNEQLINEVEVLIKSDLITKENDKYKCNETLVLELMSFITTPCGCIKK